MRAASCMLITAEDEDGEGGKCGGDEFPFLGMKRSRQPAESVWGQQGEARQALTPSATGFQLMPSHHPDQPLAQEQHVRGKLTYSCTSLAATLAGALPHSHMVNVALFQGTKGRSFSLTENENCLLRSSCSSSVGEGRRPTVGEEGGRRGNRTSTTASQSPSPSPSSASHGVAPALLSLCLLMNPHRPQHVMLERTLFCSLSLSEDHSYNGLDFSITQQNRSEHTIFTCSPSWMSGAGKHCLARVFRSRELDKEEQEKGKWLLQCLELPLFCPQKEETDLISLRQFPKNLPGIQRKRLLFSPPTDLAAKAASHSVRGKTPILLVRAHYCQTDRPTWPGLGAGLREGEIKWPFIWCPGCLGWGGDA